MPGQRCGIETGARGVCVAKNGSVTWATLLNVDLVVRSHRSWAWTHDEVRQVFTYAPGSSSEGHAPLGPLRAWARCTSRLARPVIRENLGEMLCCVAPSVAMVQAPERIPYFEISIRIA